jgi:ParB family chromosome partitioning protein
MSEEKMNLGAYEGEQVLEMDIDRLRDFRNHPFKITADMSMVELKESIEKFGILNPLIIRPVLDGCYEIISGHRRRYAAKQLGYRKVPVVIRVMKDDEAVVAMVDSNLQREYISPSEKAFAYKMKYDVLRHRSGENTCGRVVHRPKGKRTIEVLAEEYGESPKQIQRYLKITELIPELLAKLDDDELSISSAVEIAFLKTEEQEWFLQAMDYAQASPSLSQAQRIKKMSQEEKLSLTEMQDILCEVKRDDVSRVSFKTEQLRKYFPKDYTVEMMKHEMIDILKAWMEQYWDL